MFNRALHFVGSVPAEVSGDTEQAMRWLLDGAGAHEMTALPNEDTVWIVPWLMARRTITDTGRGQEPRPVFEVVVDGKATDYRDLPMFRIAKGIALRPEHIALGRVRQVSQKMPVFRQLRNLYGRPHLRHQVSVPSPLDMALFTLASPKAPIGLFAKAGAVAIALRHYRLFRDTELGEIAELHDRFADELVYQVEAPTVLIGLWTVPAPLRPVVAWLLARQIAGFLTRFPDDARVVLHLCYGDLGHRSMVRPDSLKPAVLFLNILASQLRRRNRELPNVHLPAAFGDQPPPVDDEFYQPLTRLDNGYRLYAGVADHRDPDVSSTALRLFEKAARRRAVAVGTACGFGREPVELANNAITVCRTLAEVSYPLTETRAH
ncbi:hypothetical protein [Actinophytocola sp.]|uniref:hypothetical protein n=1 Tax=Actinophytocola sp. TaxID=1872138 RepID=UPI002ED17E84